MRGWWRRWRRRFGRRPSIGVLSNEQIDRMPKRSRDRDLETTNVEAAARFERDRCEP